MSNLETLPFNHPLANLKSSQEVYREVMQLAGELSFILKDDADALPPLYTEMGVEATRTERVSDNLQGHTGYVKYDGGLPSRSFKARGLGFAAYKATLDNPSLEHIDIASAGNAALAANLAGRRLGLKTTAYMSRRASEAKVRALQDNDTEVINDFDSYEQAVVGAARASRNDAARLELQASDQLEVIAGNASAGFEIVYDLMSLQRTGELDLHKDLVDILEPCGKGGLLAGVACAIRWAKNAKLLGDNIRVIGVQMEGCDAMGRAVQLIRQCQKLPDDLFADGLPFNAMADGTAVRLPGRLAVAIAANPHFVHGIRRVHPWEVSQAMDRLAQIHGTPVEPAGALSWAGAERAARRAKKDVGTRPRHIFTHTTGTNMDAATARYFTEVGATRIDVAGRGQERAARATDRAASSQDANHKPHKSATANTQYRTRVWSSPLAGKR